MLYQNLKLKIELKNKSNYFTIDSRATIKYKIHLLYPSQKQKRLLFNRNIKTDKFNYREISHKLNKKIVYKEGKITQSLYKSAD